MPQAPVVTERKVPVSSLPDSRINVSVNPGQFGADIASGLGAVGQNMAKMQAEDDAAAATDVFNLASEDSRKYLYEGADAVYSQQGKNATGSHDTSKKFFEETYSKYSSDLKNERQKAAFKSLWDGRTRTNLDNVARHEAGQRKVYFEETQQANLQTNINNAADNYNKPDVVETSIRNADTVIRSNPGGKSEAVVLEKQAVARSDIRSSVIFRMMVDDPDAASKYYDEHKKEIHGKDTHLKIQSGLKGNKQKRQAQIDADKIMRSDKTDAEKRTAAKKEKNPEVRALTEGLVNQDISREKTDRIENERQMKETFWTGFLKNPDINNIPESLPPEVKLSAIKFASSGATRKTDLKRWNEINQLSINDPAAFIEMDLYNDVNNLDESDFQSFGSLQRSMGGDKQTLTHVQSVGSKATKALKEIGKKVESEAGQIFMRKFQRDVSALETNEKRKIRPDEVDAVIDRLMIEGEVPGSFYDPDKRLFELDPTETEDFFVQDVPDAERAKIVDAYKRAGKVPTEEEIVGLYTQKVTKR